MRRHQHHRLSRTAVTALVVCGVAVPSAAASSVDLRSPDTRDAAVAAAATLDTTDLRSADARVSSPGPAPRVYVDLRSPDAKAAEIEAQRPDVVASSPAVTIDRVTEASGFDWGDFAVGAGAALAMVLLGFGAVTLSHQRGRTGGSGPSPLAS